MTSGISRSARAWLLFAAFGVVSVVCVLAFTNANLGFFHNPESFLEGNVAERPAVAAGGLVLPGSVSSSGGTVAFRLQNLLRCKRLPVEQCNVDVRIAAELFASHQAGDKVIVRGGYDGDRTITAESIERIARLSYGEHTFYVLGAYSVVLLALGLIAVLTIGRHERLVRELEWLRD